MRRSPVDVVPIADLHARTIEAVERLRPQASEELGPIDKDGKRDRTHLSQSGKDLTARLLVAELRKVAPDLARCFRPLAKPQPGKLQAAHRVVPPRGNFGVVTSSCVHGESTDNSATTS